jgi:hypothetical protein
MPNRHQDGKEAHDREGPELKDFEIAEQFTKTATWTVWPKVEANPESCNRASYGD